MGSSAGRNRSRLPDNLRQANSVASKNAPHYMPIQLAFHTTKVQYFVEGLVITCSNDRRSPAPMLAFAMFRIRLQSKTDSVRNDIHAPLHRSLVDDLPLFLGSFLADNKIAVSRSRTPRQNSRSAASQSPTLPARRRRKNDGT